MRRSWPRWQSAMTYALKDMPVLGRSIANILVFETAKTPHFESDQTCKWFADRLQRSRRYLEFGSGGTTFLAAELNVPFVSKESDQLFSLSVQQTIETAGLVRSNQVFLHADIGVTENWGYPFLLGQPTPRRLAKFAAYSDGPPFQSPPDFILIDGRFRLACMLKCVKALVARDDWIIAFDDYAERPHYHVVEQFAQLEQMVGRMAVFRAKPDVEMAALEQVLSDHLHDFR